jgi:hypothetical protein
MTNDPAQVGAPPLGQWPWLVLFALLVHVAEEWPRFPEWATGHFGTTSPSFYIATHIPIVGLVAWATYRATRSGADRRSVWLVAVVLAALVTNALFHVGASIAFREVSPGLVSASLLYAPLALYLGPRMAPILGRTGSIMACAVGLLVSVLFTLSLGMDMPML